MSSSVYPGHRAPGAYRCVAAVLWAGAACGIAWMVNSPVGIAPDGWTVPILALLLLVSTVGTTWQADMSSGTHLTIVEAFSIPMLVLAGPIPALLAVVSASLIRAFLFWDLPHPRRLHLVLTMQSSHVLELTMAYLAIGLLPDDADPKFAVAVGAAVSIAMSFICAIAWTDTFLGIRTSGRQATRDIAEQFMLVPTFAVMTMSLRAGSPLLMALMFSVLFALDHTVRENRRRHQAEAHVDVDGLTGLPNHRRFWTTLEDICGPSAGGKANVSVVLIDIDDFKQVNDVHGHLEGDEVLRQVGAAIDAATRPTDRVFRYGGEEFAILLPKTSPEAARQVAERVRLALPSCHRLRPTASLGVVTSSELWSTPRSLVEVADKALYRAKRAGKNRTEQALENTAQVVESLLP